VKKGPAGGTTLDSRTHAYRTGAGGLGAGTCPAFVKSEPGDFPRLYRTVHSESTVDKWNNFSISDMEHVSLAVAAGEAQSARDNRSAHRRQKNHRAFSSIPELAAAICEIVLRACLLLFR
jgi:hypothetical protein